MDTVELSKAEQELIAFQRREDIRSLNRREDVSFHARSTRWPEPKNARKSTPYSKSVLSIHATTEQIQEALTVAKEKTSLKRSWLDGLCSTSPHRWRIKQSEVRPNHNGAFLWGCLVNIVEREYHQLDKSKGAIAQ